MSTKANNRENYMYMLATVVTIGFFTTLIFMIHSGEYKTEVNMIVGALIGAFVTVVGFFFGSSMSSAAKTEMIYSSTPTKLPLIPDENVNNL